MGFFDNLFGFDDMIKNQRNDIIDLFASSALFDNPTVRITTFHKLISDIHEEVTGRRIKYLEQHKGFARRALMDCIDSYPEGQQEYIKDLDVFIDEIAFLESFNITSLVTNPLIYGVYVSENIPILIYSPSFQK